MSGLRQTLKRLWFGLRRVDPEAVVVTFATGPAPLARAMHDQVQRLVPDRRHFLVEMQSGGTWYLWRRLRRLFGGMRIGLAPLLIHGGPEFAPLRRAAWLLAPRKILAFNPRLERHHLSIGSWLSSILFAAGIPLDRIHLRPWFWPWAKDRSTIPPGHRMIAGRAASPARARAAVATPFFPWPLSHGGAVRIFHLLKEAAREFDIDLFAFAEHETEEDFAQLARFCHRLFLLPKPRYREPHWSTLLPPQVHEYWSPELEYLLALHRAPVTQIEYTQLALYRGNILVEHDITADLYRQIQERAPSTMAWWNWWRWRRCERRAIGQADAVVVMSEKDAALTGHPRAVVISNGVDLARFMPGPEPAGAERPQILFIGSFRHFPNVSAIRFFLDEVWPGLDGVDLTVVAGPDPEPHWGGALPNLEHVRFLGYVADVKPLYDQANLVVVPTLVSAGTNIKVLEAMAMERAVVSTSSGCAGLGLVHGESVWIADGAAAFADGVRLLAGDAALRRRLAATARRHAERHFSWTQLGRRQRELWRQWAPSPLTLRPGAEADLAGIARIQSASPHAAQWPPADYLAQRLTVATLHGQVVGFAVARSVAPDEHELLNIAVEPAYRGHGIGGRLLESLLDALAGGVFLEVRESNTAAIAFYQKAGFRVSGMRKAYYRDPVESGIVMTRQKC